MIHRIDHMKHQPGVGTRSPLPDGVKLKPGNVFTGTVVQKFNDGRVMVTFGGKPFLAHTTLDLIKGQPHRFQVKTMNPHIELKVLDGKPHAALSPIQIWASTKHLRGKLSGILTDLANARDVRTLKPETSQTLNSLSRLLPAAVYSRPGNDDARWLSGLLPGSGLFWESKIARYLQGDKASHWNNIWMKDLKGILLSLNRSVSAKGTEESNLQFMAQHVKDALHLIEQDQFFNLSTIKDGLGWFW
ncbi:MAG: hypothetical protein JRJ85_24915, partial [Deltaproteobacteria bacterium]|nr:hypothetical protein [Deltaproteobacteria bacterium]